MTTTDPITATCEHGGKPVALVAIIDGVRVCDDCADRAFEDSLLERAAGGALPG
jgi:hypothetical protein